MRMDGVLLSMRSVDCDGGEARQGGGFLLYRRRDQRAGALGQRELECRGMSARRHFAQGLAEDVDDLVVVVAAVFCHKFVEIIGQKDNGRDVFERLRLRVFFQLLFFDERPTCAASASL